MGGIEEKKSVMVESQCILDTGADCMGNKIY